MTDHKQAALKALHDIEHTEGNNLPGDWAGASENEQFMVMATLAEAQVHATLHLAEQQAKAAEQLRIANLIALSDDLGAWVGPDASEAASGEEHRKARDAFWSNIRTEIRTALGLDG